MKRLLSGFFALCLFTGDITAQEWTTVPQREPRPSPKLMCWVTHREPDYWVTVPGYWYEPCPCNWGPWHWENGEYVRICKWEWQPATSKLIPGRTYKRWEPCPKRHILDNEKEQSNGGVVNPSEHPIESRDRGVLESRRTRTTPTCD